jgi:hypothetical protein
MEENIKTTNSSKLISPEELNKVQEEGEEIQKAIQESFKNNTNLKLKEQDNKLLITDSQNNELLITDEVRTYLEIYLNVIKEMFKFNLELKKV